MAYQLEISTNTHTHAHICNRGRKVKLQMRKCFCDSDLCVLHARTLLHTWKWQRHKQQQQQTGGPADGEKRFASASCLDKVWAWEASARLVIWIRASILLAGDSPANAAVWTAPACLLLLFVFRSDTGSSARVMELKPSLRSDTTTFSCGRH